MEYVLKKLKKKKSSLKKILWRFPLDCSQFSVSVLSFYLLSQTSSFKQFIQNKEGKEVKTARVTCVETVLLQTVRGFASTS